MIHLVKS